MTLTTHRCPGAVRTLVRGLVLALVLAVLAGAAPAQARQVDPRFFGMHDGDIRHGSVPGVATGATRLWDTGTTWIDMTDSLGQLDLGRARQAVATAEDAGLRPLLVLGQTPPLHEDPTDTASGPNSMPRLDSWTSYVAQLSHEFGDRVDYQIWNEPNVPRFWNGSVAQMATLTATASRTIRGVVPGATVVAPSFPLRLQAQREWFREYWAQKPDGRGLATYVDVVSVNPYPSEKAPPEAQLPLVRSARTALPEAGRRLPMWNTEINYGLEGGTEQGAAAPIPEAQQAAYVARTLLLNAGSSIRRVYWYRWDVSPIANTHLVEGDGATLSRAGRAWNEVRRWLSGTDVRGCSQTTRGKLRGLFTCTARKSKREVRRVYWKPAGGLVTVKVHRTARTKTLLSGTASRLRGGSRIKVGSTPLMVTSRR